MNHAESLLHQSQVFQVILNKWLLFFLFFCFQNGDAKYKYISAKQLHFSEDCFIPFIGVGEWVLINQCKTSENLVQQICCFKFNRKKILSFTNKGLKKWIKPEFVHEEQRKEFDWIPRTNVILILKSKYFLSCFCSLRSSLLNL